MQSTCSDTLQQKLSKLQQNVRRIKTKPVIFPTLRRHNDKKVSSSIMQSQLRHTIQSLLCANGVSWKSQFMMAAWRIKNNANHWRVLSKCRCNRGATVTYWFSEVKHSCIRREEEDEPEKEDVICDEKRGKTITDGQIALVSDDLRNESQKNRLQWVREPIHYCSC